VHKRMKKSAPGPPVWLLTFSDMMLLLLTFFVVLLSMAKMDLIKFQEAAGSLRGAFGVMDRSDKTEIDKLIAINTLSVHDDFINRVYKRLFSHLSRLNIDKDIILVKDRGSVVLRVNNAILFDKASTTIKPEAYPVLRKIIQLVKPLPMNLRIEGHSDNQPFNTVQKDNWNISTQRSVNVLKIIAAEQLMPLDRVAAVGYGSTRPLVENDTEEHRAMNRRVEFYLENLAGQNERLPFLIDAREQLPF
jgi:chemotaxis protein MotB